MGKLSAKRVEAELKKPGEKSRKVSDGDGLYLEVTPNGKGRWRFRYRFSRKEQMLSLGLYPAVSLRQAR
ncbi:MAG: DUF4102 domain-containing protein, partial [Deltaproteobacteria bacterium]|nr:DUF4102 domain-containing protein [Deltaproteobacteria bacterium]